MMGTILVLLLFLFAAIGVLAVVGGITALVYASRIVEHVTIYTKDEEKIL
jgi:hypothetical protein